MNDEEKKQMIVGQEFKERAEEKLVGYVQKGDYHGLLRAMAYNTRFSLNNICLIYDQFEGAEEVRTLQGWNTVGRFIDSQKYSIGLIGISPVYDDDESLDRDRNWKIPIGYKPQYLFEFSVTDGAQVLEPVLHPYETEKLEKEIIKGLENSLSWVSSSGEKHAAKIKIDKDVADGVPDIYDYIDNAVNRLVDRKMKNFYYKGLRNEEYEGIDQIIKNNARHVMHIKLGLEPTEVQTPNTENFTKEQLDKFVNSLNTVRQVVLDMSSNIYFTTKNKRMEMSAEKALNLAGEKEMESSEEIQNI